MSDNFFEYEPDTVATVEEHIMVRVKAETDKAWLCMIEDDLSDHWFPKSVCALISGKILCVPHWLLEEKGLDHLIGDRYE